MKEMQIIDLAAQWPCKEDDWASHIDFARAVIAADRDEWRDAVLNELAVACLDAPQDEPPRSILQRIIQTNIDIALDPRVSDRARQVWRLASDDSVKNLMEQAQVYASSWSLVGSRFAGEDQLEDAHREKEILRAMLEHLLSPKEPSDAPSLAAGLRDGWELG